jgi:hypothetical protein
MTLISTTMQPARTFDADAAELESLTRQGLVVGVGRPPGPPARPDPVVAYVSTTLNPDAVIGVDDAELESLLRQGLVAHNFGPGAGVAPVAAGVGAARTPAVTVSSAVSAGVASGAGAAYGAIQPTGYGVGGYGTQPYGV